MVNGVKKGIWEYNIPISDAEIEMLRNDEGLLELCGVNPAIITDGIISFRQERNWETGKHCLYNLCVESKLLGDIK